jgi:hypothetical protein
MHLKTPLRLHASLYRRLRSESSKDHDQTLRYWYVFISVYADIVEARHGKVLRDLLGTVKLAWTYNQV